MKGDGRPVVLSSTPVAETWEGDKLPGPWLVRTAADLASERAAIFGLAAVSIRRAHHIGCLAAYLPRVVERGQVMQLLCSDPGTASVAPWGGTRRVITPNPLRRLAEPRGAGDDRRVHVHHHQRHDRPPPGGGDALPLQALLDADGTPTDDPNVFFTEPAGTLLPLGGMAAGHKGFGLGLMVEALTSALGGYGRADPPAGWGASVMVLVIDPARFGGTEAFLRETGWMADAVHGNPPVAGGPAPRLPGERAWQRRTQALAEGVVLHPSIPPMLAARGAKAGIAAPPPIGQG